MSISSSIFSIAFFVFLYQDKRVRRLFITLFIFLAGFLFLIKSPLFAAAHCGLYDLGVCVASQGLTIPIGYIDHPNDNQKCQPGETCAYPDDQHRCGENGNGYCMRPADGCGIFFNGGPGGATGACTSYGNETIGYVCCDPTKNTAGASNGNKPVNPPNTDVVAPTIANPCNGDVCNTAIGPIGVKDGTAFITAIFSFVLSIAGGIAIILILYSGYLIIMSQGNAEKVKGAQETLTAAIIGLVFIILSVAILQIIGVDILKLPGFTK